MAVDLAGPAVGSAATVLVGATGATVGASVTARREHRKWLREERFRACVELLAAVEGRAASCEIKFGPVGESERDTYLRRREEQAEQLAATARVQTALAAVDVVGPPPLVSDLARAFADENDPDHRGPLVNAVRGVLGSARL